MNWNIEDQCRVNSEDGVCEILAIFDNRVVLKRYEDDSRFEANIDELVSASDSTIEIVSRAEQVLRENGFPDKYGDALLTLCRNGMLSMPRR